MSNSLFDFDGLFIFDLANNHEGSVEHARRIIQEVGKAASAAGIRGGLKFQFRELDTFVHPSHAKGSSNRHIPRFLANRLSLDHYAALVKEVRAAGMIALATPFDEASVDLAVGLGIDVVKVASCSANDWPLLEKIAECNKPVIFSTGGLSWREIDDLVSFFDHRRVHFAILHCVSIYPTPREKLQLNQIERLRNRYPGKAIGFSTHENPDDLDPVRIAIAKGAVILERHVGIPTEDRRLNAYSSTPAQLAAWIKAAVDARSVCGVASTSEPSEEEIASIRPLQRGVFARKPLAPGTRVTREDVFFAMPWCPGQLLSGEWTEGIEACEEIQEHQPLMLAKLKIPNDADRETLFAAIHTVKGMLNEAGVVLPVDFETEFSHHYGISNFAEVGAIILNCVNRSYCKKLIVMLPGQRHPSHYHKTKEETFQVLSGVLEMNVEGRRRTLYPGDIQLVQQGVWHEFWSEGGVVFEELSTRHYNSDSFYEDKTINQTPRERRKTIVNQWGRYQI